MQPKSNKFLIPVYYTDTIIYKFGAKDLYQQPVSGGFLCGKNGRDRCDRAGVQAYCLQSEAGEKGA